jgi:hypothetical protein
LRIILSRKGFDSSAGGCASPILPDGRLFSLPIPFCGESITYAQIQFQFEDRSTVQILNDLCPGGYRVNKQAPLSPWAVTPAHLDPDLRPGDLSREPAWRPLFGQDGAAQAHLDVHGAATGDLFLFFGWFRQTRWNHGQLKYTRNAPHLHLMFGWLEIGNVWRAPQCPPAHFPHWANYHPHAVRNYGHANNTVYVAARGGAFRHYHPLLQLTAPDCPRRSEWRLPPWFYPFHPDVPRPPLTYHENQDRWTLNGEQLILRSVGRGQEFVLDLDRYPEAHRWVEPILALPTV